MATTKNLLDIEKLQDQMVIIITSVKSVDENGMQDNYSQSGFLKGCDGIFVYYSFSGKNVTGCIPVDKILDIIKVEDIDAMEAEHEFHSHGDEGESN